MRKNKKHISPKSKYNAVLDLMGGKGTLEKVAMKYNMSVTTLWKYNANADAAIRKVVGLEENCIPCQGSQGLAQSDASKIENMKTTKKHDSNNDNELVIRITY